MSSCTKGDEDEEPPPMRLPVAIATAIRTRMALSTRVASFQGCSLDCRSLVSIEAVSTRRSSRVMESSRDGSTDTGTSSLEAPTAASDLARVRSRAPPTTTFLGKAFLGAAFVGATFLGTAFLDAAFVEATFLGTAFLDAAFVGATFLGVAFVGATFLGTAFLGAAFLSATLGAVSSCARSLRAARREARP